MMYVQASRDLSLFDGSMKGKRGYLPDKPFGKPPKVPQKLKRKNDLALPELTEMDVVRHYIALSQMNYGVDSNFYPLGSCTMKYNPKINETLALHEEVISHHPLEPDQFVQGNLEIMWRLSRMLAKISGTDEVTLQPAAGAHGEFLGAKIIAAYHNDKGEKRDEMIVPDSAHGTNPASSAMAGFRTVEIPSGKDGQMDIDALGAAVNDKTAGLMLTNPNTLGIFESKIDEIAEMVHEHGGLLYYDGANLNALLGKVRPGDMGFDIIHFNLHKTFSTPHGGGGPGGGAIGVKSFLHDYLPIPIIIRKNGIYKYNYDLPHTIGKVRSFHGNFAILVRAYAYLCSLGKNISDVSEIAVLNANYLMHRLKDHFEVPYLETTPLRKHEFVVSCESIKRETGITAMEIARRLLDYGYHSPTVYFPLIVKEALMIEPTETESIDALDSFADALINIKNECYEDPDVVKNAPHNTSRRKLDLVKAARNPVLSWKMMRK